MRHRIINGCRVEIQVDQGVIYVHHPSEAYTLIRIWGLSSEQCEEEQIDVRAQQPDSHSETMGVYYQASRGTTLPSYCSWCGVLLRGGATEHKEGCELLKLIRDVRGDVRGGKR